MASSFFIIFSSFLVFFTIRSCGSMWLCTSGPILATRRGYFLGVPTGFSLSPYTRTFMLFRNYFSVLQHPSSSSLPPPLPQQGYIVFYSLISSTNSIKSFLFNWRPMSTMALHSTLASSYNLWPFWIMFGPYLEISVFSVYFELPWWCNTCRITARLHICSLYQVEACFLLKGVPHPFYE